MSSGADKELSVSVALQVVRDPVRMFAAAEFFHGAIPFVVFLIFGLQRVCQMSNE